MHDGDKIQLALLDFIDDPSVALKTKSRAYLDYQLKNHSLGEWDEVKGVYKKFFGNILVDGKITKLSENRETALEQIKDVLGMNEEQLNMRTKTFDVYSHAVYERARKELKKHYNSIYEMMSELQESSKDGTLIRKDQIDLVRDVVKKASEGVHSNIAKQKIRGSYNILNRLEKGFLDVSSNINDMDLVGQTAMYLLKKEDIKDSGSLYKKVMKEIDKFISRADFDEFYKESSTKGVFNELTGQRNTGLTHSYATKLMMASVELSKINPTDVMSKLGEYATRKTDINVLSEMKRKQEYYSLNMDLLVDNMIESAISAKHGLTLGGLEGSKIFINELLDNKAESMNNKVLQMFDDVFINNDKRKTVNLLENVAFYKTEFDKRNSALEDITDEVVSRGLDSGIFMKQFDLGREEFQRLFKGSVSSKDMKTYLGLGSRYKNEARNIEMAMFNHALDKQYVNPDEFKIFQGLNLFGELLIQNDPGLEYDTEVVNELFEKYNKGEIKYKDLLRNSDIKNLKAQVYTSLGSAASISNVGKMRDYLSAFVENNGNEILWKRFEEDIVNSMKYDKENFKLLKKHNVYDIFENDYTIKEAFRDRVKSSEKLEELLSYYAGEKDKLSHKFYNSVMSKGSDPMGAYLEVLNKNYTIFNHGGKSGSDSLEQLKKFKEDGIGSLNESVFSKSVDGIDERRNEFINELMSRYSEYDPTFKNFNTDELVKKLLTNPDNEELQKDVISQLNKSIDDALFFKYKNEIPNLKVGDNSKMVKLAFVEKLNEQEERLKKMGKLYHIYPKSTPVSTPINYLEDVLRHDSRNFIIDDMRFFYNKGEFDTKRFNKVFKMSQSYNLFFSNEIARKIFSSKNMADTLISPEERRMLGQSMLNARKYLGEDFTRENVLKRLNMKFDSELASATAVGRFLHDNPELNRDGFNKKLRTNLKKIIDDFHEVDRSIDNDFINTNYIKMAKTYVDAGKEYISIGKLDDDVKRFKRSQRSLERIISQHKKWFEDNEIDIDLFSKLASSEFANQDKKSIEGIKRTLMNVAQAMKGSEVSDIKLKYSPILDTFVDTVSQNKKYGLAAMLGAGLLTAGSIIKPFFADTSGTYTLSKNVNNLDEKQLMEKLNFSNGLKTDMITEELKVVNPSVYVGVKGKEYF